MQRAEAKEETQACRYSSFTIRIPAPGLFVAPTPAGLPAFRMAGEAFFILKKMYQLLNAPREDILAVRFTGKMESQDYDRLVPVFEERIAQWAR